MATPSTVPQTAAPAATAPAAAAQLPDLPEAAVSCIVQHVPLRQRLNSCALVCRAWAAAAAVAPAEVDVVLEDSKHCQQLQHWLAKQGAVVVGLTARAKEYKSWNQRPTLQLPISQLTRLRNLSIGNWVKVQLPTPVATRSNARRQRGSILAAGTSGHAVGSIGSAVAVLPQLQELRLSWDCGLTMQLLSQLLSATSLSKLHWDSPKVHGNAIVAGLLDFRQVYSTLWQRLQLLPQLTELSLVVSSLAVDIGPLSNIQHLLRLNIRVSCLLEDSIPRAVLSALQHLTQLQHLELHDVELLMFSDLQGHGTYPCFSALTASTQLTALHLENNMDVPVPQPAFQHMFPARRVLPKLKELRLIGDSQCVCDDAPRQPCVEAAQIAMIAASCPALQELALQYVTPGAFDVSCLSQLPSGVRKVKGLVWTRPAP